MQQDRTIQWFPGHMTKTRRRIVELLPQVDAVIEVIDARIPISSRNPDLDGILGQKPRLLVLNKADMADEDTTRLWTSWYLRHGQKTLVTDCKSGRGMEKCVPMLRDMLKPLLEARAAKGMDGRSVRVMIVGIPNSGKSSFINRLRGGSSKAHVEDRPGVTRDTQWYAVEGGVDLLDTPGVLWPKFDDQSVARHLAFTGAIRDEILDCEELACDLLSVMREHYADRLRERYKLTGELPEDSYELLELIGRKRGMLVSGGEVNTERAASTVLDEYRGGKFGRLTLELPPAE